jgi:6,7-dimethyl-8-ribityllumazine synthase
MHRGVAIIVSRYNPSITDRLLAGALATYRARRPDGPEPTVVPAPGTFELPALAVAAIRTGRFGGVLALGCVIKGETSHDRHIARAVANALAAIPLHLGVPAAFGVLTVDTPEQAAARAGGSRGNKGADSMGALLDAMEVIDALDSGEGLPDVATRHDKATGEDS